MSWTNYIVKVLKLLGRGLFIIFFLLLLTIFVINVSQLAHRPSWTNTTKELAPGIKYYRKVLSQPRPNILHLVSINLAQPDLKLITSIPNSSKGKEIIAKTTSDFVKQTNAVVAINASFFQPFFSADYTLDNFYPHAGDPVDIIGQAIHRGQQYSADDVPYPKLCIFSDMVTIQTDSCPSQTVEAIAGSHLLIQNGQKLTSPLDSSAKPEPRTAVGLSAGHTQLWFIVVDGRQPNYSEGVTWQELADLLLPYQFDSVLNLDGGGSSTLVTAGSPVPEILNAPIHTRIMMRERPVGNHLGVIMESDAR